MSGNFMVSLAGEWAVRITLIAAATAAVLKLFGIRQARARHLAWSVVVILSLLTPAARQWMPAIPLRILPARPAVALVRLSSPQAAIGVARATNGVAASPALPSLTPSVPKRSPASRMDWFQWIAAVYFAVAGFLLARVAAGTMLARRLLREAAPSGGRMVNRRCASPVTVGWLRPVVLLPSDWRRWPADQLSAVLDHEAEHARWRDPLMQWLAALNRSVFWFHPLTWWLERHLNDLAEEACDQAAIAGGADPGAYAQWLVGFARSVRQAGGLMRAASMPMAGALLPRLRRLHSLGGCAAVAPARAAAAAVACGVLSLGIACAAIERRSQAIQMGAASPAVPVTGAVEPKASVVLPQSKPALSRRKPQVAAANTAMGAARSSTRSAAPAPEFLPPAGEYVIYMDLDSIAPSSREAAIAAVKRGLDREPRVPTSLVVYRGGSIETVRSFTPDTEAVLAAAEDVAGAPEAATKGDAGVEGLDEVAGDFRSDSPRKQILWVAGLSAIATPARHPQIRVYEDALRLRGIELAIAPVSPDGR